MTSKSKQKGTRIENKVVNLHKDAGLAAKRIPLSGAVEGFKGDVQIGDLKAEVKSRKDGQGFRVIEKWLGNNDLLFLHRNNQELLVVMPWRTYLNFATTRKDCPKYRLDSDDKTDSSP